MAEIILESSDTIAMLNELDGLGKEIEALPQNTLRKETEEKLKRLRASVQTNTQDGVLRAGINDIKTDINAIQKMKEGEKEIRETLSELSPEKIESAVQSTERIINLLPDGKYKTLLRGYAGSVMLEQFENRNHRIILGQNNTVSVGLIDPNKGTQEIIQNKIDLEKKLNTLLTTRKLDMDTLRTGMLYRSPSFLSYSNTVRGTEGQVLDSSKTQNPKEYFQYLAEKRKNGYVLTQAEETLVCSEAGFDGYNSMLSAVTEVKDLGQMQKMVQKTANQAPVSAVASTGPQSGNAAPSVVGEGLGVLGGTIGKLAGAGAKGGVGLIGDIFKGATKEGGAMGWLVVLGGLIAAIWKFGLWKTLGTIFGVGLVSEAASGRINLDKEIGKVKEIWETVGSATASATASLGAGVAAITAKKPGDMVDMIAAVSLSPSQKKATEKVTGDAELAQIIEMHANKPNQPENGKLQDYLTFIHSSDFQNKTLDKIIYNTHRDQSIFSNGNVLDIGMNVPDNLNPALLKQVIRQYLLWSRELELPTQGAAVGDKEYAKFTKKHDVGAYKNKTFKNLIEETYPV